MLVLTLNAGALEGLQERLQHRNTLVSVGAAENSQGADSIWQTAASVPRARAAIAAADHLLGAASCETEELHIGTAHILYD